jgi:hypothetical protein
MYFKSFSIEMVLLLSLVIVVVAFAAHQLVPAKKEHASTRGNEMRIAMIKKFPAQYSHLDLSK